MKLGIDVLLKSKVLLKQLHNKRVALLATPASVTSDFKLTLDVLAQHEMINLTAAIGPQHGIRGDKQDNMVETHNTFDEQLGIPIFSLYGKSRRLTAEMLATFDVLLFDVQDVGCRIYTFISTLFYVLEDSCQNGKAVWILDRPNPAGRPVEGLTLQKGYESFVGAAPIPMRHGLTMAEAAIWYADYKGLTLDIKVVAMEGYEPLAKPHYGWPKDELCWINPSPNLSTPQSARTFPGTVLLEGTTLSEGRGTTRALEQFGAPDLPIEMILKRMKQLAPDWMLGIRYRIVYFEPTFHKHVGQLCTGIHLHSDYTDYNHEQFKPFRWMILFLKALRLECPDYVIWRDFPYEYEVDRLAIDVINGGPLLREWVDDPNASIQAIDSLMLADEQAWLEQIKRYYFY